MFKIRDKWIEYIHSMKNSRLSKNISITRYVAKDYMEDQKEKRHKSGTGHLGQQEDDDVYVRQW